ncbi:MAG: alpha/beta hydrolase [Ilumatobacter sp.]
MIEERAFPGAVAPARAYRVDADGVGIAVHEWGSESDPVLMLVHGGADFARTYDVLAPKLAAAGWRVVAWDQRGHGDSDHAHLYSFDADLRDAATVFDRVAGRSRVAVVGHSKGGAIMTALADAHPFRFGAFVNLDGIPYRRPGPDVPEHQRAGALGTELASWLAHRRRTAGGQRRPGTIAELAARRGMMNPRLPAEWLEYLVTVGGRHDSDGWRWKLDPSMRLGGFGPWRPEWALFRLAGLAVPFLGVLVGAEEPMGWGTRPEHVSQYLPRRSRLEFFEDLGHFVHIEQPDMISELIVDFLGAAL